MRVLKHRIGDWVHHHRVYRIVIEFTLYHTIHCCLDFSCSSSYLRVSIFCSRSIFCLFKSSFSAISYSMSVSDGAPRLFLMNSITLFGFSGSSYSPTRTLVSWSMTPAFSKYLRNSSFFYSVVCTDIFITNLNKIYFYLTYYYILKSENRNIGHAPSLHPFFLNYISSTKY